MHRLDPDLRSLAASYAAGSFNADACPTMTLMRWLRCTFAPAHLRRRFAAHQRNALLCMSEMWLIEIIHIGRASVARELCERAVDVEAARRHFSNNVIGSACARGNLSMLRLVKQYELASSPDQMVIGNAYLEDSNVIRGLIMSTVAWVFHGFSGLRVSSEYKGRRGQALRIARELLSWTSADAMLWDDVRAVFK